VTKVRKAPLKKQQKRKINWANIIFLAIGVLVALSMVITAVVTLNPQPLAPNVLPTTIPAEPTAMPSAVPTVAPTP